MCTWACVSALALGWVWGVQSGLVCTGWGVACADGLVNTGWVWWVQNGLVCTGWGVACADGHVCTGLGVVGAEWAGVCWVGCGMCRWACVHWVGVLHVQTGWCALGMTLCILPVK